MRTAILFCAAAIAGAALTGAGLPASADALQGMNFGALAVDRLGDFAWGSSHNYSSRDEARQAALIECSLRGDRCRIVVEFTGGGCASYHAADAKDATAWGWGTGDSQAEAEQRSQRECLARSDGAECRNQVSACNDADGTEIEAINVAG
jgi:Domain of unknown function (DUF4189)